MGWAPSHVCSVHLFQIYQFFRVGQDLQDKFEINRDYDRFEITFLKFQFLELKA